MGKPKKRPPKSIDMEEMATILSYAELHGDKAAAAEFNVSTRTLQRRRAKMREGNDDSMVALVAQHKGQALERCSDLLTNTYEAALRRLHDVLPGATVEESISAVQMLGELHISRKAILGVDGDDDEANAGFVGSHSTNANGPGAFARTTH